MRNTLKVERAKKDITQGELAEALNVSRLTVHSIEVGKFNPSILIALKMARHFSVAVEDIFILDDTD